jgi:uncharacterized CHY-type Zn-finger protein
MKQTMINRICLCDHCRKAFIINEQGDESRCDNCLAEDELTHEMIDSGDLIGVNYDRA